MSTKVTTMSNPKMPRNTILMGDTLMLNCWDPSPLWLRILAKISPRLAVSAVQWRVK